MQLPSVRNLKYYVDANLESAGDSISRISQSRKQYVAMIEEMAEEKVENAHDPGTGGMFNNLRPAIDCVHKKL